MSLDEIQRELKAIDDFDTLLMAEPSCRFEDVIGHAVRIARKKELLEMAKRIAVRN